jgi:Uma2 family endonuclease
MIELLERPAVRHQVALLSVDAYHTLRDLGLVREKTELLNGVIVEKMTKSPLHTFLAHRLYDYLSVDLPPGYQLRKEDPLTLATSEPQPDLSVVAGDAETFRDQHPITAELVVEIAVSSVEIDRAKADLYAAAGVPTYWLVLAEAAAVDVYTEPGPAGYGQVRRLWADDSLCSWYGRPIVLDELFR